MENKVDFVLLIRPHKIYYNCVKDFFKMQHLALPYNCLVIIHLEYKSLEVLQPYCCNAEFCTLLNCFLPTIFHSINLPHNNYGTYIAT